MVIKSQTKSPTNLDQPGPLHHVKDWIEARIGGEVELRENQWGKHSLHVDEWNGDLNPKTQSQTNIRMEHGGVCFVSQLG